MWINNFLILDWQDAPTLLALRRNGVRNDRESAMVIRDHMKDYYNNVGRVWWQNQAAERHVIIIYF